MLGSRSALDWIIDRYQPRYIIDLIGRITRISITTMTITDQLPELPLT